MAFAGSHAIHFLLLLLWLYQRHSYIYNSTLHASAATAIGIGFPVDFPPLDENNLFSIFHAVSPHSTLHFLIMQGLVSLTRTVGSMNDVAVHPTREMMTDTHPYLSHHKLICGPLIVHSGPGRINDGSSRVLADTFVIVGVGETIKDTCYTIHYESCLFLESKKSIEILTN